MTINLNAYDKIEVNYNNKSWINPIYKKLYSNEIEFRNYYSFLERYNKQLNAYDYFVILSDVQYDDINWHSTIKKKNNIILNLQNIWNKAQFNKITRKEFISLNKVDSDKDSIIYYINI